MLHASKPLQDSAVNTPGQSTSPPTVKSTTAHPSSDPLLPPPTPPSPKVLPSDPKTSLLLLATTPAGKTITSPRRCSTGGPRRPHRTAVGLCRAHPGTLRPWHSCAASWHLLCSRGQPMPAPHAAARVQLPPGQPAAAEASQCLHLTAAACHWWSCTKGPTKQMWQVRGMYVYVCIHVHMQGWCQSVGAPAPAVQRVTPPPGVTPPVTPG
jgi:hypothetical protein